MTRSALIACLAMGCLPKHSYPHGEGIEGQLEREIVALTARLSVCEVERADCTQHEQRESLYHHLRQIFYESGAVIGREGDVAYMVLPWSQLFKSGLAHAESARMILDLLATTLEIHQHHQVRITAIPGPTPVPRWLRRRYPTHWEYGLAAMKTLMNVVVTDFEVPEERFMVASRGPHGIDPSSDALEHGPRVVLEFIPAGP